MEGARGHEEDVIGLHHPVLGLHVRTLHDREQVALHSLARDIRPAHLALLAGDLVDLVEEDDAKGFHALERVGRHVLHVDELLELLLQQDAPCFAHLHRPLPLALRHHVAQHLGEVLHAVRRTLRDRPDLDDQARLLEGLAGCC